MCIICIHVCIFLFINSSGPVQVTVTASSVNVYGVLQIRFKTSRSAMCICIFKEHWSSCKSILIGYILCSYANILSVSHHPFVPSSIYPFIHPSNYSSIHPFIHSSIYPSICSCPLILPLIHPFTYLSIHPSTHSSIHVH